MPAVLESMHINKRYWIKLL